VRIVKDATCTFCGCVCDDIELKVDGRRSSRPSGPACWAPAWFLNHEIEDRPSCLIEGQPASVEEGIERARRSWPRPYPLIYGLSDTTIEAQRVAVAIADWIGGNVDTTTSVCHGRRGMAFQGVGEVTCRWAKSATAAI
jgi:formylmethanofuran dehydrogenase subunit B